MQRGAVTPVNPNMKRLSLTLSESSRIPKTLVQLGSRVGQDGHITLGWQASGEVIGSPIVAGHTVYSVNHNTRMFYALNLSDGTTRFSLSVGKTSRFITPTPANGYIFIGTLNGIVALSAA